MNINLEEEGGLPTTHEDDLQDMRIVPPEFEGTLNSDHYLEWI